MIRREGTFGIMLRTIALASLVLMCGAPGRAEVSGAEPTVSSEMRHLMRVAKGVRIICHEAQAGIMLEGAKPVRLRLPDLGGPDTRDYFLEPVVLGRDVVDHVFARLDKTLQYCKQDEDCREPGLEQRLAASDGCAEPPEVYKPWSVFRYDGEESPLFPSGYIFMCRNAGQMLMVWLGPLSMTLRQGGQPGNSDRDGFDIAAFPLSD